MTSAKPFMAEGRTAGMFWVVKSSPVLATRWLWGYWSATVCMTLLGAALFTAVTTKALRFIICAYLEAGVRHERHRGSSLPVTWGCPGRAELLRQPCAGMVRCAGG